METFQNLFDQNSLNQVNFHAHDAMLYTGHCGDCRAVLGVHRPVSEDVSPYYSAISDSESAGNCGSSSEDDDQYSSDSLSSDDEDLDDTEFFPAAGKMSSLLPVKRLSERSSIRTVNSGLGISSSNKYLGHRTELNFNAAEHEYTTDSISSSYQKYKPSLFASKLCSIDLTTDHSPYNANEVALVLKRCRNDLLAISSAFNGGLKRVSGTLAITRALGNAYLKTPRFSFPPCKRFTPYISAMPEISNRLLTRSNNGMLSDRFLIMATDGLWEQASGRDVVQWVQAFFTSKRRGSRINRFQRCNGNVNYCSLSTTRTSSGYIIQCILNRIVRSRNISSLQALMALKKGRARRSKYDDITASVVDLTGFVL